MLLTIPSVSYICLRGVSYAHGRRVSFRRHRERQFRGVDPRRDAGQARDRKGRHPEGDDCEGPKTRERAAMILLDGREMSVEAAALALANWTIGRTPEALQPPFDIRYPYEVSA